MVVVSFVVRALAGVARPGPWILPDELLYVDLARSLANGDLPAVRGVTTMAWGVVYPLLVSPAWVLFDDSANAYRAASLINAFVMSLAAIPGYLLARLFVGRRSALLVAAGTVLVPTMALTGSVMTENAAYPLFIVVLWAVARAVRSPATTAQLAAFGTIALLTLTRTQGAILLPVWVGAVGVYALALPAAERGLYLRRFRATAVIFTGVVALAVVAAIGAGVDVSDLLGGRSSAVGALDLGSVPRLLTLQAGGLLVMAAVAPAVAGVAMIVAGLSRAAPEPHRLFAAVALPALAGSLVLVSLVSSAIDTEGAEGVNERYVFYLVPLLLTGFAAWAEATPRRGRADIWILASAAALVGFLPFGALAADATFYAPALVPWVVLPHGAAAVLAVAWAVGLGVLCLRSGTRGIRLSAVLTASWLLVIGLVAALAQHHHAATAAAGYDRVGSTWIDDAVRPANAVPVLWDQRTASRSAPAADYYSLMVAAVLNSSVTGTLRLGPATYYENVLPTTPVTVSRGVVVDATRTPVAAKVVLVPCSVAVEGRPVAKSPDGRLLVIRTAGFIRRVDRPACAPGD